MPDKKKGFRLQTELVKIDREQMSHHIMKRAGEILQNGGLVAFPTETVYGLGADALNEEAAQKIYAAKGRPSDNPLIVHIADMEALGRIAESIPKEAKTLAEAFWPGPLTMIFRKKRRCSVWNHRRSVHCGSPHALG